MKVAKSKKSFRLRKISIIIGLFILLVLVLVVIVFPVIFGILVAIPRNSEVGEAPSGFEEVIITAQDGIDLQAWYKSPQNGSVIILLHGASESRENLRKYAELLTKKGYGVLAFDQRGHGESEGRTNRFGWNGNEDVGAAVSFLEKKEEVKTIGAIGNSMGGEIILGAASSYPEITAIVSEGATYRDYEEFKATEEYSELMKKLSTSRITYLTLQLITGDKPPKPTILESIKDSNANYLFIASGEMPKEIDYNTIYKDAAGSGGELWVVEGVNHVGAFHEKEMEYTDRVIEFFDKNLLNIKD